MKVDAKVVLRSLVEKAVQQGGGAPLSSERLDELKRQAGASDADARQIADELRDRFETSGKGGDAARFAEAQAQAQGSTSRGAPAHQVRAAHEKRQPWFLAVSASTLPSIDAATAAPPRDIDLFGEKLTKDDLARLLRSLA